MATKFTAKVVYTRSGLEELNDYLAWAVATYETRMGQALRKEPPPTHPYKYLYAYDLEDAPIFFGRDAATQALYRVPPNSYTRIESVYVRIVPLCCL